jgi:hypothetical protein
LTIGVEGLRKGFEERRRASMQFRAGNGLGLTPGLKGSSVIPNGKPHHHCNDHSEQEEEVPV